MIQDIAPHTFHNEFRPGTAPGDSSPVICFDGRKILISQEVRNAGEFAKAFPAYSALGSPSDTVYAFAVDDTEFFLYIGDDILSIPEQTQHFEYTDIRSVRQMAHNIYGMICFTGYHLKSWYFDSRYCGRCGGRNEHSEHERAMHCPACDRNIYPRIMPAVIVGVTDGEHLLLTKYREGYGHYALVAGFAEIGETLEETVRREVLEETGLNVKNITYYKSQPWGIANDLLTGYFCEVDGDREIRLDQNELKLAQWKSPDEIELQPDSYSLTNEMMRVFKDNGPVAAGASYRFFENKSCRYYPCHEGISVMNCMFCYCPLYRLESCPGNPNYIESKGLLIKDCSNCTFPHVPGNYDAIIQIMKDC